MKTYKGNLKRFELKSIQSDFPKVKIGSSQDSSDLIKQFFGDDIEVFESMFLLLLNSANNTIGFAKISQGGVTSTVVDTKIIAKYAVDSLATAVIIAHNHPSGNTNPSDQDKKITIKVKNALALLDVTLLDHMILTADNGYFSFADNGLMY